MIVYINFQDHMLNGNYTSSSLLNNMNYSQIWAVPLNFTLKNVKWNLKFMTNLIETLTWEFDKNNLFLWCFVECDTVSVGDTSSKFDGDDQKTSLIFI